MSTLSLAHWALIIMITAFLVLGVMYVIKGARVQGAIPVEDVGGIANSMKWLTRFFLVVIVGFALFFVVGTSASATNSDALQRLALIALLAMVIGAVGFYVCLGVLAKHLHRSWITWVGLAMLTSPIGPIVAYFSMRSLAANALSTEEKSKVSSTPSLEKKYSRLGNLDRTRQIGRRPAGEQFSPEPFDNDQAQRLRALHALLKEGVITAEEFEAKKKEILTQL